MGLLISYLFTLVFWGLIHNIHKKEKFHQWYEWIWYSVGRWWRKKKVSWHLIRSSYTVANQNSLKHMNLSCVLGILGKTPGNKQWSYSQWGEGTCTWWKSVAPRCLTTLPGSVLLVASGEWAMLGWRAGRTKNVYAGLTSSGWIQDPPILKMTVWADVLSVNMF